MLKLRKALNKLRFKVAKPLFSLERRIRRIYVNRIGKLTILVRQDIMNRIRLLNPEARLEGYDKKFDLHVVLASLKLANPIIFEDDPFRFINRDVPDEIRKYPELKKQSSKLEETDSRLKKIYSERKSEYLENRTEVDDLTGKAQKDGNIMKLVELSHLVNHYYYGYIKMTNEADYFLAQARKINPKAFPLETKTLSAIRRASRTGIRKIRGIISDRYSFKISLSLKNAGTLISVVSSVFLISGYLYNRFLLGEFGIEVSKYFTLSDYIASSIEGIRYSASGAVIAAIGFFIGVRSSSGASLDQLELQKKKMVYPMGFLLFTSIFGSVYTYYYNFEAFFVSFYALIVVSANILSVQGIVNRYFKQPLIASFLIVFLCTFAGHMFMSIGRTIYDLKNKKLEEIKTYDLIFKEQIPLQSSKMVLIAANSNFLFLLDEDKNAFIVPKDQILYVMKRAPWKKP